MNEIKTPNNFGEREEYIIIQINLKQRWCIRIKKKKNLSSLILENYRRTKIEEQGLAQTLSLSVGSGSEAYPSIPQCGEILIMRYYDKRRTIRPYWMRDILLPFRRTEPEWCLTALFNATGGAHHRTRPTYILRADNWLHAPIYARQIIDFPETEETVRLCAGRVRNIICRSILSNFRNKVK